MYVFEYMVYHLKPYGVSTKLIKPGVSFESAYKQNPASAEHQNEPLENVDILKKLDPASARKSDETLIEPNVAISNVRDQMLPAGIDDTDLQNKLSQKIKVKPKTAMGLDEVIKYKQEMKKLNKKDILAGRQPQQMDNDISSDEKLRKNIVWNRTLANLIWIVIY